MGIKKTKRTLTALKILTVFLDRYPAIKRILKTDSDILKELKTLKKECKKEIMKAQKRK